MSEQTSIVVSNYDKVKSLAHNEQVEKSFAAVLGSRTAARGYISSVLLAVQANKDLMECQPASIMSTALRAATLRLSCDPALGQAFPVPYKGKATLQLGWRGIEQMALRTGKYRFINSGALYEGQVMEEDQLTGASRIAGQREGDKVIGYFNHFELFAGYSHTLYMTVGEIENHAARYSKTFSFGSSPWKTEFEKMAKKTVLRLNLLRHGILNPEDKALLEDMDEEAEQAADTVDTTFEDIEIKIEPPTKHTAAQNMSVLGFDADPEPEAPAPTEEVVAETGEVLPPTEVMAAMARLVGERPLGDHTPAELKALIDGKQTAATLKQSAALVLNWKQAQPNLI